jgi:hypothetical protein
MADLKYGSFKMPCDLDEILQRHYYFFGTYFWRNTFSSVGRPRQKMPRSSLRLRALSDVVARKHDRRSPPLPEKRSVLSTLLGQSGLTNWER